MNELYEEKINRSNFRKVSYLPIVLVVCYLIFTLILYTYGPFAWITYNPIMFYTLQIFYIAFLTLGYMIAIRSQNGRFTDWKKKEKNICRWILPFTAINCIVILINIARDMGHISFDISAIISEILRGMKGMGAGYNERYDRIMSALNGGMILGGTLMTLINYLWDFFSFNVLLLGIYYFKKEGIVTKILVLISALETVCFYVSIGTNIGVFRVILAVVLFLILAIIRKNCMCVAKRKRKHSKVTIALIGGSAVILVIYYFFNTMKARGGIYFWDTEYYNVGGIGLNRDSIFFKLLPTSLYMPLISLSSYLTQGYYGFSLATTIPWKPMYGVGSSKALADIITEHFTDIERFTYQYRIQEKFGWDRDVQWASMYTWTANDVGFYGTVIVMFFLGYFLAMSYKDSIVSENPFSALVVVYFGLTCIFLPCNFQIFQSTYTLFGFISVFLIWILSTRLHIKHR